MEDIISLEKLLGESMNKFNIINELKENISLLLKMSKEIP